MREGPRRRRTTKKRNLRITRKIEKKKRQGISVSVSSKRNPKSSYKRVRKFPLVDILLDLVYSFYSCFLLCYSSLCSIPLSYSTITIAVLILTISPSPVLILLGCKLKKKSTNPLLPLPIVHLRTQS